MSRKTEFANSTNSTANSFARYPMANGNGKGKGGKAGGKAGGTTTPAAAPKAIAGGKTGGKAGGKAGGTATPAAAAPTAIASAVAIASMQRYGDTQSRRAKLFMAMAVVCALIAVVALGGVFLINGSHGRLQQRLEKVEATARSLRSGCPSCPKCPSCRRQAAAVALAESKTKDGRECPAPEPSYCPSCPRGGDEGSSSKTAAAATGFADRLAEDKEAARRVFRGMPLREIEMLGQTFMSSKVH